MLKPARRRLYQSVWSLMLSLKPFFLVLVAVYAAGPSMAYEVPKRSLEARVASADIVVIGRVLQMRGSDGVSAAALASATVKVEAIFKGRADPTIELGYRSGIAEGDPVCCVLGASYFMLLKKSPSGLYESVDGPHGVLSVNDSPMSAGYPR